MNITEEQIKTIMRKVGLGLTKGLEKNSDGKMCIEAVICTVLENKHADNPACVGNEIRKAKINLNDCSWSSNQARAKGMRKLAIAQLGSINLDQIDFLNNLKLESARKILPFLIQKHYEKTKDVKLLDYKLKFESLTVLDNALWLEFYNYDYKYNYSYKYNYDYDYGDEFLNIVANTLLSVFIKMNCEGCKWLYLLDP